MAVGQLVRNAFRIKKINRSELAPSVLFDDKFQQKNLTSLLRSAAMTIQYIIKKLNRIFIC